MLVVGKDMDGSWVVRDRAGTLLGRFPSGQAARRFAERERRSGPPVPIAASTGAPSRLRGRLTLAVGRNDRGDADGS